MKNIDIERMPKDVRNPLFIAGGYAAANFGVNHFLPKLTEIAGIEGFLGEVLGAENAEVTRKIVKFGLPVILGLLGIQLSDDKDVKAFFQGVSASGIVNGLLSMVGKDEKNAVLVQKARSVNGLGNPNPEQIKALPEFKQMMEMIDNEVKQMSGSGNNEELDLTVDEDYKKIDLKGGSDKYKELDLSSGDDDFYLDLSGDDENERLALRGSDLM